MTVNTIAIEYQVPAHTIEDVYGETIADWDAELPTDTEQVIRDAMAASADADAAMHEAQS